MAYRRHQNEIAGLLRGDFDSEPEPMKINHPKVWEKNHPATKYMVDVVNLIANDKEIQNNLMNYRNNTKSRSIDFYNNNIISGRKWYFIDPHNYMSPEEYLALATITDLNVSNERRYKSKIYIR